MSHLEEALIAELEKRVSIALRVGVTPDVYASTVTHMLVLSAELKAHRAELKRLGALDIDFQYAREHALRTSLAELNQRIEDALCNEAREH